MENELSAFEVYQKQNIYKRKKPAIVSKPLKRSKTEKANSSKNLVKLPAKKPPTIKVVSQKVQNGTRQLRDRTDKKVIKGPLKKSHSDEKLDKKVTPSINLEPKASTSKVGGGKPLKKVNNKAGTKVVSSNGKLILQKVHKDKVDAGSPKKIPVISTTSKDAVVGIEQPKAVPPKKIKSNAGKKVQKSTGKLVRQETHEDNNSGSSSEEIPILVPTTSAISEMKGILSKHASENEIEVKPLQNSKNLNRQKNATSSVIGIDSPSVFNPITQGLATFKWLLDPITPKQFFEKYWEKEVLYIKRSNTKYFDQVFSTEDFDSILREFPLHFTRNIDVVAYSDGVKEVMNEEGRALPAKLWDFYSNGCSVRLLNPQTYNQNVHSIISNLQEYFGTMVGSNVYLTPPGSQGFAPHFDDIEAFIVQLEGSKCWKLYKPEEKDVLARNSSKNFSPEEIGTPFMEVTLNAGDVLYFPRGTIHQGRTEDEAHSLHITISVYQHTAYVDLLEHALPAALQKAARENVEYRKGLPLNYLKHLGLVNKRDKSITRKTIIDKVKSFVTSLVDYIDVDSAADQLGRKFMHDAMPPLCSKEEASNSCKYDGDWMKNGVVYNRVQFDADTKVRLLRYYALRVVQESDTTSKIYFCTDNANVYHGEEEQWLEIENALIPAIEMLQKKYPEFVEAEKLPIKDPVQNLVLISSLWEHGLLMTAEPLPCYSGSNASESESDSD